MLTAKLSSVRLDSDSTLELSIVFSGATKPLTDAAANHLVPDGKVTAALLRLMADEREREK